jgi:hypothetical protein
VGGGCRRPRNEEFHNLHASPNIIRVFRPTRVGWAGCVARMGQIRNAYRSLTGKPEGKTARGRQA